MAVVFVTGCAGFIGYHLAYQLLKRGDTVIGIDNLNNYYDVGLKLDRLAHLRANHQFTFYAGDITDMAVLERIFTTHEPQIVVNLAAQAGIRYSLENPMAYIQSNVVGFSCILESCRHHPVQHLVYASSSSVYGNSADIPLSVRAVTDQPISLYAATKKSNELMAYTYSHLYGIPSTGLRFFTVYGPWGLPDMAPMIFMKAILEGKPINVFNYGRMKRDFTYVDDIVGGITKIMSLPPDSGVNDSNDVTNVLPTMARHRVYNIGNSEPIELLRFISVLEEKLGKKADLKLLPAQPGDVLETHADVEDLERDFGFSPKTSIETGLSQMVTWYREYKGIQ